MRAKPSAITIAAITAMILLITATVTMLIIAHQVHEHSILTEAPPPVERQFIGNADLYRIWSNGTSNQPLAPVFRTTVLPKETDTMHAHIQNTAAQRHWIQLPRTGRYLIPDYDTEIVKEITGNPYGWATAPERLKTEYAKQPDPDDMMPVQIKVQWYQPSTYWVAGGVVTGILGLFAGLVVAMAYDNDRSNHRRRMKAANAA